VYIRPTLHVSLSSKLYVCKYLSCLDDVSVRLAGGNRPFNAGRLEIRYRAVWGTVCDDDFDNADAAVACYMLGFG